MKNNIDNIIKQHGLTVVELAKRLNTSEVQIHRLKSGKRKLTLEWLTRISAALDCEVSDLIKTNPNTNEKNQSFQKPAITPIMRKRTCFVVGYVGAGAEVYSVDAYAKGDGMEEVECPSNLNPEDVIALRVKGDSMYPRFEDGDLIFYRRDFYGIDEQCFNNRPCIVGLKDGRNFVKIIKPGTKKGHFNLLSHNAPMIENVKVSWCAKILSITPR
jgi:phage repressor protein C with HTH and peptisase S24 domain